jgi:chromosome partitioning protein
MKTISIVNQKGGVGKTTITSTLLHLLSNNNLKVLGIDLDPQANLSLTLLKKNSKR